MTNSKNTIFVQIAAYRDPELIPTIDSLLENSVYPENLRIVVCWQHGDEVSLKTFEDNGFSIMKSKTRKFKKKFPIHTLSKANATVELIDVHYNDTEGACWARNAIQQHYKNEKYTLQLDSHHRFVENFDTLMIEMLEGLRPESPKPVLTAYLPSFDPENDPAGRNGTPWRMNFDRFIPEGAIFFLPSGIENWKEMNGVPIKARFYSGHFTFADGSFAAEVQHDPDYFFHGEEISIAVRAFTHGYDLYHPTVPVAWHEYTRSYRTHVWDDHTTEIKNAGKIEKDWCERNNECHKRNRILFGMDGENPTQIDFGKYGFGKNRTLRQYEEYAGISFELRGIQSDTKENKDPPVSLKYETEQQWRDSFIKSNDVRILLHRSELEPDIDDYDFWYIGTHDENDEELYRKDAQEVDIANYLSTEWVDFRFIFFANVTPATFTVWPHSKSRGWLTKITKPIEAV